MAGSTWCTLPHVDYNEPKKLYLYFRGWRTMESSSIFHRKVPKEIILIFFTRKIVIAVPWKGI